VYAIINIGFRKIFEKQHIYPSIVNLREGSKVEKGMVDGEKRTEQTEKAG
jgi:hypothetical protein